MSPDEAEPPQCILIVDDDETILRILARILKQHGYETDTAESGRKALDKSATKLYIAAVIDMRLGDMNGLDLLEPLRTISPKMTKIMLTGHPSDEDRVRALERGANFYLAKPIKAELLIKIIDGKLKKEKPKLA